MKRPDRHSAVLVLVLLLLSILRAVFASTVDLAPDEAYYWTWSNHLAAGYFDHPPAVAWLVRLGTVLFGDTALGVRIGAIGCSAVSSWVIFVLVRRIVRSSAWAFWMTIMATVSPVMSTGAVIHTPDAELSLTWALAAWAALMAFETNRPKFWLSLGVAVGFALMSKGSAILLVVGLGLYALTCKAGKDCLKTSGPVMGLSVAAIVASPNLVWNIQHRGGSLMFQANHAAGTLAFRPLGVLEFVLGQAGILGLLLFVGVVAFGLVGWRRRVRFGQTEAYLMWCLFAPVLLVTFLLSSLHKVEANWPAVGYISAVAGAAWALSGGWWYVKRRKLWTSLGVGLALSLTLLIHAQALWGVLPMDASHDPTARLRGWRSMAVAAGDLADSLDANLAAEGYGPVSELMFYTNKQVLYQRSSFRLSQFDLWPKERIPERLLFIQPRSTKGTPEVCKDAARISDVTPKLDDGGLEKTSEYRWWLCDGITDDTSAHIGSENGTDGNG